MYYYELFYHRGLNGPTVYFQTLGDNAPPTLLGGGAAESTPLTFASMLADPQPGDPNHLMKKCTFALNLRVYAKHTNGSRPLTEYNREDQAAFALEIA